MKKTSKVFAHPQWKGNPRQYQLRAQKLYSEHYNRGLLPWTWITLSCDFDWCLNPRHMRIHQPKIIAYRRGVCVYCGEGASGVDHLLPEPWTGKGVRHMVAVVPACASCNSRINDFPSPNIAERRRKAQVSIERKFKHLLLRPTKEAADLMELGHAMRSIAYKNNLLAERVRARLGWPLDPYYDLRAFQKSGIEDPMSLGLCDLESTPLRPEYAA